MHADLILVGGTIHTMSSRLPSASALAVRDGVIVYVGQGSSADTEALSLLRSGGEVIDLRGRCVVPGLNDAHLHLQHWSLALDQVNVETPTLGDALAAVAERAGRQPEGDWISGWGWNHNAWGGDLPKSAHLDGVAPGHPVALTAKSGHAMWVNSRALAMAGISDQTCDPLGGRIVRDARGQPTGILLEEAMSLVQRVIPLPTQQRVVEAMRRAIPMALRAGLTGVHDMDGPLAFAAEQTLYARGELGLRVLKSIPLEHLDEAIGLGLHTGFGDDWLRVGQVKMFADGALGPRTAWMLEAYEGEEGNNGVSVTPPEVLRAAVSKANASGLGCAIHAIGDRAVREVLDVYAGVRHLAFPGGPRNRIEHVQLLSAQDEGRLAELGVVASMQPIHATSDMLMAERYWGARCMRAYALKSQVTHGAVLALGSDCPVEPINPLYGVHAAVTRRRPDGFPGPEGWWPGLRLTVGEALRGFTWGPTVAAGTEARVGSLEVGNLADMTVLDQDIFRIDPMEMRSVRVLGTMVGGRFGWRANDL